MTKIHFMRWKYLFNRSVPGKEEKKCLTDHDATVFTNYQAGIQIKFFSYAFLRHKALKSGLFQEKIGQHTIEIFQRAQNFDSYFGHIFLLQLLTFKKK